MRNKNKRIYNGGHYGELRAQFLKQNYPKLFQQMQDEGTLDDYLDCYQKAYALRSERLFDSFAKEKKLFTNLYDRDFPTFMKTSYHIALAVEQTLKKEIERL